MDMLFLPVAALGLATGNSFTSFAAFRAVGMARQSRLSTLPTPQAVLLNDRFGPAILPVVVGLPLAPSLPFCCTYLAELAPWQTFPATSTTGDVLLPLCLLRQYWPLEAKGIEQAEAVLSVLVPVEMLFTNLAARTQRLSQGPPAHVGLPAASPYVA